MFYYGIYIELMKSEIILCCQVWSGLVALQLALLQLLPTIAAGSRQVPASGAKFREVPSGFEAGRKSSCSYLKMEDFWAIFTS